MNENIIDGQMLQVSGWGATQSSSESRTFLRAVIIPSVNQQECQTAYSSFGGITPRMFCAGFKNGG